MTDRAMVSGESAPTMAADAGRREALLRIALDPETEPDVLTMLAHEDAADDGVLLALICHPQSRWLPTGRRETSLMNARPRQSSIAQCSAT